MEPTLLILLSLQRGRVGAQVLPPGLQTSCLHPLPGAGDSLKENPNILHPSAMLGPACGDGDEPYREEKAKVKVPAWLSPPLHPRLTLLYGSKEQPRPLPAAQSCAGRGEKTKQGLQSPATRSLPTVPSPLGTLLEHHEGRVKAGAQGASTHARTLRHTPCDRF